MGSLTVNHWWTGAMGASSNSLLWRNSTFMSGKFKVIYDMQKTLYPRSVNGLNFCPMSSARRNSANKPKKAGKTSQSVADISPKDEDGQDDNKLNASDDSVGQKLNTVPSRGKVLQACAVTSGLIAALGVVLRQVSHFASTEGLPILDCSSIVSFDFEMWHLELITGLVVVISSCRYLLLKTWPEFAESSEAANQQVLALLHPLDYLVVAFLPGISEELLFRGALLPLFGFDWKSVLVVAAIFGVLHIGGGRKYSFAVWATFVGLVYGYATILSSSVIVPMASHAVNNLVGGIIWRYESSSSNQN